MNKLSIRNIALIAVGASTGVLLHGGFANAAGSTGVREISRNNLYTCPGRTYEFLFEQGNVYNARAVMTIVCMADDNQARWIIRTGAECDLDPNLGGVCQGNRPLPLRANVTYPSTEIQPGNNQIAHHYGFRQGVLSEFCKLEVMPDDYMSAISFLGGSSAWNCQKHQALHDVELETFGSSTLSLYGSSHENTPDPYLEILNVEYNDFMVNP
ncbi:hypothetical protein [Nodosilinea sp. P-1105]|uniref:hypothetical protein n=1 Tax=Nodosilinea sp. P-1105 TaxID=2546229 RepID=UPI00146A35F0|nr:hypothetical protein [Nodosilinea sp. P-1105]NMF84651.1 hypothetical protein [Nodosilinea sp. P-1105]